MNGATAPMLDACVMLFPFPLVRKNFSARIAGSNFQSQLLQSS